MSLSPLEREVLIDLYHNPGSTRDQVRYRLSGDSPVQVNQAIETVIRMGLAVYRPNCKLEITELGQNKIILGTITRSGKVAMPV